MKVVWTPQAEQDRDDIWLHIATDNPGAAVRMDELFSDAAARLADHPKLGHPGKIAGTRELIPHENYRLVYELAGETVWVLTLVHTSRQGPPVQGTQPLPACCTALAACGHGVGEHAVELGCRQV